MVRTGSCALGLLLALGLASRAGAEVSVEQQVDRTEVGTEDTFVVTVWITDPPPDAQVQFPVGDAFEILSRAQSDQMSYQFGGGGSSSRRMKRFTLVTRALRAGKLTLPGAVVTAGGKTWRAESTTLTVREGSVGGRTNPNGRGSGWGTFPGFPDDLDDFFSFPQPSIPRSDSDVFVRAMVDPPDAYVGQQVTYSVYVFSRVEVAGFEKVSMPKMEGFLVEDTENSAPPRPEEKEVDGVPYRAYLLARRALFPLKEGTISIQPFEVNIVAGVLFPSHRVRRKSNVLTLNVKPLPSPIPQGVTSTQVGDWQLRTELSAAQVSLGEPVQIRLVLEGNGNVRNLNLPRLPPIPGVKLYEPTVVDQVSPGARGKVQGRKVVEYLAIAQNEGSFTVPELSFSAFRPDDKSYVQVKSAATTWTVRAEGVSDVRGAEVATPKNLLEGGKLQPLRHRAQFQTPTAGLWSAAWFPWAVAAPAGLWVMGAAAQAIRNRLGAPGPAARRRRGKKEAMTRLRSLGPSKEKRSLQELAIEVERALRAYLASRLGQTGVGLTRDALDLRMEEDGMRPAQRQRLLGALERCDAARYAPNSAAAEKQALLTLAEQALEETE